MQGMGLDFLSKAGGVADPVLITIVANIIFDVRQGWPPCAAQSLPCLCACADGMRCPWRARWHREGAAV